jgi:eukaryotic-like serine/threonine-protein kinase
MDRTGATTPLRATGAEWYTPRFSPDGQKLALSIRDATQSDVWIYEWARDTLMKFTFDAAFESFPVWTPDGRRVLFSSERATKGVSNLYWQRADGTGDVQRLTDSPANQVPFSIHPSGKWIAFAEQKSGATWGIVVLPIEGDETTGWKPGKPTTFLDTPALEYAPMFSPDGRWIAYMSNESGRMEVYVRPFPGPGGKWQISTDGGGYPVWSKKKPELLFSIAIAGRFYFASYTAEGDSFRADKPQAWSPTPYLQPGNTPVYDLHPDGLRVAAPKAPETTTEKRDKVVFVFNFFEELRRSTAAR